MVKNRYKEGTLGQLPKQPPATMLKGALEHQSLTLSKNKVSSRVNLTPSSVKRATFQGRAKERPFHFSVPSHLRLKKEQFQRIKSNFRCDIPKIGIDLLPPPLPTVGRTISDESTRMNDSSSSMFSPGVLDPRVWLLA